MAGTGDHARYAGLTGLPLSLLQGDRLHELKVLGR
jgi:hypothetical protein